MAFADFEQLCTGFCELAEMSSPALVPHAHGALAFSIRFRGVDLTVLEIPAMRPGVAYMMAELGPMPEDLQAAGWRALMEANRQMLGAACAPYARDPETGQVIFQRAVALAHAVPVDVYQCARDMVDLALQWRRDCFLGGSSKGLFAGCSVAAAVGDTARLSGGPPIL